MPRSVSVSPLLRLVAVILPLTLGACATDATAPSGVTTANVDPWEGFNRDIWAFDTKLDRWILKPVASAYRDVTPDFMQHGLSNLLRNLKTPTIMLNDLLQGNFGQLGDSTARFGLNTIFGFGGFVDVASRAKIPFHEADFGQTLGSWGVGSGPYLVLPFFGPSDPRDAVGFGVDSFADAFAILMRAHGFSEANAARTVAGIISDRAETIDQLDEVEKSSLDYYAAIRSLYLQSRAAAVRRAQNGGKDVPPPSVIDEAPGPTPSEGPQPSASPTPGPTPPPTDLPTPSAPPKG